MDKAARLKDLSACTTTGGSAPLAEPCDASVLIEGVPAARLTSKVGCPDHEAEMVSGGAAMVLIGGLPAARVGDGILDRGVIVGPGANQVLIGGPTFSVPSVIAIEGDEAYRSKVVQDLYFISTTKSGRELFARLERAGHKVTITMPPPTHDKNWTDPESDDSAVHGVPCGSTIHYKPDHQALSTGPDGEPFYISPQEALMHEGLHALMNSEGTMPTGGDPAIKGTWRAENQVIGLGSYENAHPTENTFRDDLGLRPRRATHLAADPKNYPELPEQQSFRPR